MRKIAIVLAPLLLQVLVLPCSCGPTIDIVEFPDSNLESVIREAIKKPTGNISKTNLEELTVLCANYRDITDLTGLEYCDLLQLELRSNQITAISPLSRLKGLHYLDLRANQIDDISSLSEITNLTWVDLSNNAVSDIRPLVMNIGLGEGDIVKLAGNNLSITSVTVYIPQLQERGVKVSFGEISDKEPVLAGILAAINPNNTLTETELIDEIRFFISNNCVHSGHGGLEHLKPDDYWRSVSDINSVLSRLLQTYRNNEDPLYLTCGPRALAMQRILDYADIDSVFVQIFSDDYQGVHSHSFLDVFNSEHGKWEAQDPTFDIYYVEKTGGKRLSAIQLVVCDLTYFIPRSYRTDGWEGNNIGHLKGHYFGAVMYERSSGTIIININRFDIEKRFPGNGNITFNEFAYQSKGAPEILLYPDAFFDCFDVQFDPRNIVPMNIP